MSEVLYIQILHSLGVRFYEEPTGFNIVAHKNAENLVGFFGVANAYLLAYTRIDINTYYINIIKTVQ